MFKFTCAYVPTSVSKVLPQKSVFATTNKIIREMVRITMANRISHAPAMEFLCVVKASEDGIKTFLRTGGATHPKLTAALSIRLI